jgi:hypothetical protein
LQHSVAGGPNFIIKKSHLIIILPRFFFSGHVKSSVHFCMIIVNRVRCLITCFINCKWFGGRVAGCKFLVFSYGKCDFVYEIEWLFNLERGQFIVFLSLIKGLAKCPAWSLITRLMALISKMQTGAAWLTSVNILECKRIKCEHH